MNSGKLDRYITIQSATETKDSFGAPIQTWATLASVWAQIKEVRGKEYFAAQAVNSEVDTIFAIRYRSDVTTKMRISYDSKTYDIQSVVEVGRRDGLELYTRVHR